jgi:putative transposase
MQVWQRPEVSGAQQHTRQPIEAKESSRWLAGYRRAWESPPTCPATLGVHMADRAGASQEGLVDTRRREPDQRAEVLIRATCRAHLQKTPLFPLVDAQVWHKDWVVHCKPVGSGQAAFRYLAPYIFRVAISSRSTGAAAASPVRWYGLAAPCGCKSTRGRGKKRCTSGQRMEQSAAERPQDRRRHACLRSTVASRYPWSDQSSPLALWFKLQACYPHPASFNPELCGGSAPHEFLIR